MNRKISETLKAKDGASSILVIIMMLVLIILSLAIASTSISNRKLSEKKQKWLNSYYALDSKAQETLAKIDTEIKLSKLTSESADEYKKKLDENLKKLEQIQYCLPYNEKYGDINISYEIKEDDSNYNKRIFVNIVVPLIKKDEADDYHITCYQLLQEPLVQEETMEFENPF